jgi:hypothetical protein
MMRAHCVAVQFAVFVLCIDVVNAGKAGLFQCLLQSQLAGIALYEEASDGRKQRQPGHAGVEDAGIQSGIFGYSSQRREP